MSTLGQTVGNLGGARLLAMGGVGIGLLAFFFYLTTRLTSPDMVLLYSDLDPTESGQIVTKLDTMSVPYQLRGEGTQIYVPNDQVLRLRVSLAESGLPSGGSVGYEIFDKSETLGSTNFVQNVNLVRALEGELARTIASIAHVQNARVHMVMPRRQLFTRDQAEPTASVVLKMRGNNRLNGNQVLAVQHLVAAAVPGLKPTRVSVIDNQGNLLARSMQESADGAALPGASEDMRRTYERNLAQSVEELLERSIGFGKVRAEVTAEMDFDRITTNAEVFDPDGQVVRSTQTIEEDAKTAEGTTGQPVSVSGNIPDPNAVPSASDGETNTESSRTEETVNYEISRTVKTHVRETGIVKRLSVAVLVDGTYATAEDGTRTYQPRSDEEMEQITKLVKSTIGYEEARGDQLQVINMPFAKVEDVWDTETTPPLFGLSKSDYFRAAEIMILAIVAVLVILLVIRPLIARVLDSLPPPQSAEQKLLARQSSAAPSLAAPGAPDAPPGADPMIDIAQVDGRVQASSLKKIGEIVDKHPEETVAIVRNWMYQES